MVSWCVYENKDKYEVVRIRNSEKEVLDETDIDRFGMVCVFQDIKQALQLKKVLNEAE